MPAKKPTKIASAPVEMGTVKQRLDKPELVANLSHVEVTELTERRRLVERFEQEALDANRVVILLRSEYTKFASALVTKYNLNDSDDHNIDTENGVIWRTATYVPVEAETVEEATEATVTE